MADTPEEKNIVVNKKARHEYIVLDTYEAGISLLGTEVKALRQNKANIVDSYASVRNGEVWLYSLHISEYKQANVFNHEPTRTRRLLLKKNEIRKLQKSTNEKGHTLIPLRLYFKRGKVKVELGLAKGKKIYDKREDIAKKDAKRNMERKINL